MWVLQVENQRLYTVVDRLNTRGSDRSSDTASQLSDLSTYAPREVTHTAPAMYSTLSSQSSTTHLPGGYIPLSWHGQCQKDGTRDACGDYEGGVLWRMPDVLSVLCDSARQLSHLLCMLACRMEPGGTLRCW